MTIHSMAREQLIDRIIELEAKLEKCNCGNNTGIVLDNVSANVLIIDKNYNIIYFTPSFKWLLGYETDQLVSKNFFDYIHEDNVDDIKKILNSAQDSSNTFMVPEIKMKHNRGAWIHMEGDLINQQNNPEIQGLILNLHDITQKKLYEIDYARLLGALQTSSDSFMLCDNDGHILFVNDAAVTLYGAEKKSEIFGKNIISLLPEEERHLVLHKNGTNGIKSIEHTFLTRESTNVPVETSVSIMIGSDGSQIGYVFISRDITARKKAEKELISYRYHLEDIVKARTDELHHSMEQLKKTLEGIITSMAYTVETKDPYTAGHQRRVSDLACAIAVEMSLDKEVIEGIRMASMIHDIGKIYVPAEILTRHGSLDDIEFMLIKKHPQVGYDILRTIEFPWPIAEIVYQHHEKLDGSGYPNGLIDEEILLQAKILSVADVVEAMMLFRPYRRGLGIETAMEEVTNNKGKLYDATVVDACVKLFNEKGYSFEY